MENNRTNKTKIEDYGNEFLTAQCGLSLHNCIKRERTYERGTSITDTTGAKSRSWCGRVQTYGQRQILPGPQQLKTSCIKTSWYTYKKQVVTDMK